MEALGPRLRGDDELLLSAFLRPASCVLRPAYCSSVLLLLTEQRGGTEQRWPRPHPSHSRGGGNPRHPTSLLLEVEALGPRLRGDDQVRCHSRAGGNPGRPTSLLLEVEALGPRL